MHTVSFVAITNLEGGVVETNEYGFSRVPWYLHGNEETTALAMKVLYDKLMTGGGDVVMFDKCNFDATPVLHKLPSEKTVIVIGDGTVPHVIYVKNFDEGIERFKKTNLNSIIVYGGTHMYERLFEYNNFVDGVVYTFPVSGSCFEKFPFDYYEKFFESTYPQQSYTETYYNNRNAFTGGWFETPLCRVKRSKPLHRIHVGGFALTDSNYGLAADPCHTDLIVPWETNEATKEHTAKCKKHLIGELRRVCYTKDGAVVTDSRTMNALDNEGIVFTSDAIFVIVGDGKPAAGRIYAADYESAVRWCSDNGKIICVYGGRDLYANMVEKTKLGCIVVYKAPVRGGSSEKFPVELYGKYKNPDHETPGFDYFEVDVYQNF